MDEPTLDNIRLFGEVP